MAAKQQGSVKRGPIVHSTPGSTGAGSWHSTALRNPCAQQLLWDGGPGGRSLFLGGPLADAQAFSNTCWDVDLRAGKRFLCSSLYSMDTHSKAADGRPKLFYGLLGMLLWGSLWKRSGLCPEVPV